MPFSSLCRYLQQNQAAFNSNQMAYYRLLDATTCLVATEGSLYGQAALVKFSLMPELEAALGLLLSKLLQEPMTARLSEDLCTILCEFSLLVELIGTHFDFCLSGFFRRRVNDAYNRALNFATLLRHLGSLSTDKLRSNVGLHPDPDSLDTLLGHFLEVFIKRLPGIAPEHAHSLLSAIKELAAEGSDPSGLTLTCSMVASIIYARQGRWPEAYEHLKAWILSPLQIPETPSSRSLYFMLLSQLSMPHSGGKASIVAILTSECKDEALLFALEPLLDLPG
jgi:hypothetical protein